MTELALIGRADELELARGMLRRARDGAPGLLLVGGEAGVGRSRLAAAIAAEAVATGVRAATGTCVRMDAGALTYAAIITALRSLAADADPGEVARTLGAYRHEVARLLPELVRPRARRATRQATIRWPASDCSRPSPAGSIAWPKATRCC